MTCSRCGRDAVMTQAYAGVDLCGSHLSEAVERRVRKRIRDDGLIPAWASPDDPIRWVIGLSGGKDSAVLTQILAETFETDPRVELVCLTIHEGIEGYRDESLNACREQTDDLGLEHEVVTYADEFDVEMDNVVESDPENMAACAYCGVFRRDILSRYAADLEADLLLTGHNLDDEAETALMNVLEGDIAQIAKHFDASLGALSERTDTEAFIPRAKPLRDVPEGEVALYAHCNDIPVHMAECPHASESFRGEIQSLMLDLEERHPGTRHSIMAGYEDLAALAAQARERDDGNFGECDRCGAPTHREQCRKCELVDAIHAAP